MRPSGGFRELITQGLAQPPDKLHAALGGATRLGHERRERGSPFGGRRDQLGRPLLAAAVSLRPEGVLGREDDLPRDWFEGLEGTMGEVGDLRLVVKPFMSWMEESRSSLSVVELF